MSPLFLFFALAAAFNSLYDWLAIAADARNGSSNVSEPYDYASRYTALSFQYRGVALGGWLLLEPWITPSLFLQFNETSHNASDIPPDEYTFCETLGADAEDQLVRHWDSFYNELDFRQIKAYGFNMVRIPIGYWAFAMLDDDPYVLGAQEYLDRAIGWAHTHGLKVWVDLHGAPGLQNGFDNLGRFLANKPRWQKKPEYVDLTLRVLEQIYSKYGLADFFDKYNDTILGIEVLNEPLGPLLSMHEVQAFYNETYLLLRYLQDTNNTIVFHDAFQESGYWNDFLNSTGKMPGRLQNYNILIDHHHYEVFSAGQLNSTIAEHITNIRNFALGIYSEARAHPAVVGEWLAALTDCTPWLNGVKCGTRWEGTSPYENDPIENKNLGLCDAINDWSKWSTYHKVDTRKFVEIQLDRYEKTKGWVFWTYKTETSIEWDFRRLAEYGLFPQPFSDRKYIVNGTDTKPEASGGVRNYMGFWPVAAALITILGAAGF